jgi:hypothetical protein
MARNVVCCETAIRLKSGANRKCLAHIQNVTSEPYQAVHVGSAVDLRRARYLSARKGAGNP